MNMEMPKRTPEHDRLNYMVGEWKTREVHHPAPWAPNGGTGEGRASVRWGVNNLVLLTDYKSTSSMMGSFEGHGVETWDPQRKVYANRWCDSMMPVAKEMLGHLEGNDLIYTSEMDSPMGPCKMRMVSQPVSKDEWKFTLYFDQEGKYVETMSITYVRA